MVITCLYSCRKDEIEPNRIPAGPEYFNMKAGSYAIYSVYEVLYDDFTNSTDTLIYQIKEHNESVFKDLKGRNAMRIDRYKRQSDSAEWVYMHTWYAATDQQSAERVEDNSRFIKLSFPMNPEAVWDANSHNASGPNNVYYGIINKSFQLDTVRYPSTVSVEGITVKNSGKERAYKEVYAKNIGLVYQYYVNIDADITGKLLRGVRRNMKLIAYAD